eukprot:CAMPEP_0179449970 /NCGR_PEP_ID=MMETSP0799-20121207/33805_1 /TAXON_ID=46947 /ORGANISM="Geminigera cryophila, Strain CCMP2564" /LENGTH=170 /DNA_ID=CAMNT_0021243323 /DNA_START=119 /DNA_END=631 /DNA_ORIENTATION=-
MHYQGQTSSLPAPHYFPQFAGRPQFTDFGGAGLPANSHYGRPSPSPGRQDFGNNFRGGPPRGRGGRGHAVAEGDWTCPNCNANVFASKRSCFKCQTPNPSGGGGGGGGGNYGGGGYGGGGGNGGGGQWGGGGGGGYGGPPPRDGDWTCPSCGANVFASKSECYKCHTPKQ